MSMKIDFNWRAYWEAFKERHGGNPVTHRGRALFQDGWTHALTSYRGPEWPPPEDPDKLRELQIAYWEIRSEELRQERQEIGDVYEQVDRMEQEFDAPLFHRVTERQNGRKVTRNERVDLQGIKLRLEHVDAQLLEAGEKLSTLRGETDGCC